VSVRSALGGRDAGRRIDYQRVSLKEVFEGFRICRPQGPDEIPPFVVLGRPAAVRARWSNTWPGGRRTASNPSPSATDPVRVRLRSGSLAVSRTTLRAACLLPANFYTDVHPAHGRGMAALVAARRSNAAAGRFDEILAIHHS